MAIDAPLFLTPLPGVTSMLATECRQRLGDLAADTLVINVGRHSAQGAGTTIVRPDHACCAWAS